MAVLRRLLFTILSDSEVIGMTLHAALVALLLMKCQVRINIFLIKMFLVSENTDIALTM